MNKIVVNDNTFDIFIQKYIKDRYTKELLAVDFLIVHLLNPKENDGKYNLWFGIPGKYSVKCITEDLASDKKFMALIKKYQKSLKRFHFYPVTQDAKTHEGLLANYNFVLYDTLNKTIDIFDTVSKDYVDLGKYRKQFKILFELIYGHNITINYRNNVLKRFNKIPGKDTCVLKNFEYSKEVLDSNLVQVLWFLDLRLKDLDINTNAVIEKIKMINSKDTCSLFNEYTKILDKVVGEYEVKYRGSKISIKSKSNFLQKILSLILKNKK